MEDSGTALVARGKYLEFLRTSGGWEYVHRLKSERGLAILAISKEARMVVVEQYRPPLARPVLELPAGLVDPGEDEISAVKRELEEETGYLCETVALLSRGAIAPGLTDEQNSLYFASGLTSSDQGQDNVSCEFGTVVHREVRGVRQEGERIIVYEVPVSNAVRWLHEQQGRGKVVDLRVFAGLFFATTLPTA